MLFFWQQKTQFIAEENTLKTFLVNPDSYVHTENDCDHIFEVNRLHSFACGIWSLVAEMVSDGNTCI